MSPFQIPPACNAQPRKIPGSTFFPNWWMRDWSFRGYWMIFNQWTKRNDRSFKWFTKTPFTWCFFIRQFVLHISQIAVTFHGVLHQFSSGHDCNNIADVPSFILRAALFAIPFVSERWGVDVQWFHERSSQALPNFQGIVSVNDLWFLIWLQELSPFSFLRSSCFTRIRLNPLSSQVLHHHSISMIVSRFTSFTKNFVICFNQVTKFFCTRYDFTSTSSARGNGNLDPLASLAISVFREVCENTVIAQYHSLLRL